MPDSPNASPGKPTEPSLQDGGDALKPGSMLAGFEIRETIGAGGFGIVYRAWDDALQRDVAVKEYMPVSLAGRGGGERVTLRSRMNEETFALGLQSFVNEARLLARFDQPALVKVFRFWEGNGTAYMAMPLYQGRTLRQLRKDAPAGAFDDAWLRALIFPLLGALEVMHAAEVYHRDIAPDNILWCDDGRPVLLDFGAARLVLADRTQNVTAVLKPQFAPIEQYAETQSMRQGPWTDLYALAGTCYFMLTGRAPLPATARVLTDELAPLARQALPGCSRRMLEMLDWAMAVRPQDRPQSVAEFREALSGRLHVPGTEEPAFDPTAVVPPPGGPGSYDKTMQATMKMTSRTPGPPRAHEPARAARPAHRPRDAEPHAIDDKPERSVMLPPKSRSPLKAVIVLAMLAGAVGGAWAVRDRWMPMLQGTPLAAWLPAAAASAPEPAASAAVAAADASGVAATSGVAAASAPATPSSEAVVAANDAAASAAEAAAAPPPQAASTPEELAAERSARAKAAKAAKLAADRRLEARLAAIPLPPPVLPPPVAGASAAAAAPAARPAATDAPAPAPADTAGPVSNLRSLGGPRELCKDGEPAQVAACVKRLCDTDARYRRYPVCLRIHKQEATQGQ